MAGTAPDLRTYLRSETSDAHDRLDRSMRPASDWRSDRDYSRFLSLQYEARLPVESWLLAYAPAGFNPPVQTPLIARDLSAIGSPVPARHRGFALTQMSEHAAIGVAWVLAGSSLGNRTILRDMQQACPDDRTWSHEFLGSRAMTRFWKSLLPRMGTPSAPEQMAEASRAASFAFDHFLAVSQVAQLEATP